MRDSGPALPASGLPLPAPDIYLSARGMMKIFGDDAEPCARRRAKNHAERGDSEASAIWLAIATAIAALRQDVSAPAERRTGS